MKFLITINILIIFFFAFSCGEDKRIPIKAIETKKGYYEWYYYSLITSSGPDFIDYVDENCKRTLIYSGHGIIDVRLENSKIAIDCDRCDTLEFNLRYRNKIQIIKKNLSTYLENVNATHKRDSLKRNFIQRECK
jgi:hypothetical protein